MMVAWENQPSDASQGYQQNKTPRAIASYWSHFTRPDGLDSDCAPDQRSRRNWCDVSGYYHASAMSRARKYAATHQTFRIYYKM